MSTAVLGLLLWLGAWDPTWAARVDLARCTSPDGLDEIPPSGATLTVRETSRFWVSLPADLYPEEKAKLTFDGATLGRVASGEGLWDPGPCWVWDLDAELQRPGVPGTATLTVSSSVADAPPYVLRVRVEPLPDPPQQ